MNFKVGDKILFQGKPGVITGITPYWHFVDMDYGLTNPASLALKGHELIHNPPTLLEEREEFWNAL